jgi:hypothetical protein
VDTKTGSHCPITVLEWEVGHLSKSNAICEQRNTFEGSDGLERQTNILGGWYETAVILGEVVAVL